MMMLIIFLITDISMVGIFAGVYGNIAKYREGMLMGVHIPKSELEHPDVKELLQLYKKRNRQFYLWNMLAGIAVCLLCFTYFSIFITVWTLWFVEFCLLTILRVSIIIIRKYTTLSRKMDGSAQQMQMCPLQWIPVLPHKLRKRYCLQSFI